ncbi:MAG: hypothetical protein NC110_05890 [Ruminococcus sp.]|nr:hypothetical protein [Ruminococcus sp.]
MKKVTSIILSLVLICSFFGCGKKINEKETTPNIDNRTSAELTTQSKKTSDQSNPTAPAEEQGDYIIYGTGDQNIFIHKDTDFGSFKNPHKIGDSVRLRHSNINTSSTYLKEAEICDYNLTFEQVLTGEKAEQKIKETAENFDEEKFLLDENDVYLIRVKIKYNPESAISDRKPVDVYVDAVDSEDKFVGVEHRLDNSECTSEAKNGEVSNWYPLFVPKGKQFKAVFVIGDPMAYPGPSAKVYYDVQVK